jgi:hypothetical protein
MGISMMFVAILLSFNGTAKQEATSKASIAFFLTVSKTYFWIGVAMANRIQKFMLCFGASLNAIPWCYSAEILPLRVRAQGTSLAVMNNWLWVRRY